MKPALPCYLSIHKMAKYWQLKHVLNRKAEWTHIAPIPQNSTCLSYVTNLTQSPLLYYESSEFEKNLPENRLFLIIIPQYPYVSPFLCVTVYPLNANRLCENRFHSVAIIHLASHLYDGNVCVSIKSRKIKYKNRK